MVRRNGNVSIYSYVIRMLQVNLVPVHTTYIRPYIVLGTSWYQPGTSLQYSSYGWNFSLVITAHTATTLHETQNGFGREQRWMEVQITGLHRRRRSRNRWCFGGVGGTNLNTHTDIVSNN